MDNLPQAVPSDVPMELSVQDVLTQLKKVQDLMKVAMKAGEDYGVIPGTNKPTLLKPGAEKLNLLFRLDAEYESFETYDGDHLTIKSKCTLYHIPTGLRVGSGEGSCSTKETKYAYRNAGIVCPSCGKETVIKGKAEYGGGFLCFAKKGGCGEKFPDSQFEGAQAGKVANDNLADQYNTVLKMSNKRSLIAADLNATAASAIFTQDLEDMVENGQKFSGGETTKKQQQAKQQAGNGGDKPPSFTLTKSHEALRSAILDYTGGSNKQAADLLEELTTWTDKNKVVHPGRRSISEISEKAAIVAKRILDNRTASSGREPGEEG